MVDMFAGIELFIAMAHCLLEALNRLVSNCAATKEQSRGSGE